MSLIPNRATSYDYNMSDFSFIFGELEERGLGRMGGMLDKKNPKKNKQVSSVLFWPVLHNYTTESILIGSVFMQNYYQCPSEAVVERSGGKRNGFYIDEPRVHLHMDEDY